MKNRLRLMVAATTSLVLAAFVVPLGLMLRAQAEDRAVVAVSLQTQSVSAQVLAGDSARLQTTLNRVNARAGRRVTVFLPGGDVIGARARSGNAVELARRGLSFAADTRGGREFLVPVEGLPGGTAVIRTFVSERELHRGVTQGWLVLAGVSILLLALGMALGEALGRGLVRSVRNLVTVADQLSSGDLTARATPGGPVEIRRIGAELNGLADRIRKLLVTERQETADFAHQLRTATAPPEPQLDVDSLRTSAPTGLRENEAETPEPAEAYDSVHHQVGDPDHLAGDPRHLVDDRRPPVAGDPLSSHPSFGDAVSSHPSFGDPVSSHPSFGDPVRSYPSRGDAVSSHPSFGDAVSSHPSFGDALRSYPSRGDAVSSYPSFSELGDVHGTSCDLAAVIVQRARYWSAVAEDGGRDLQVTTAPSPLPVRVNRTRLEAVIDALVGNVFAHTPEGTPLWILAEPTDSGGRLVVEDAGPGFPDTDIDMLAVHYRAGLGSSESSGLDSSRRTVEATGGGITLGTRRGGGAQVVVDFG